MANELLTVTQVAERWGCNRSWVHQLIQEERLKAQKVGTSYVINAKDVDKCEVRPRSKPKAKVRKRSKSG